MSSHVRLCTECRQCRPYKGGFALSVGIVSWQVWQQFQMVIPVIIGVVLSVTPNAQNVAQRFVLTVDAGQLKGV